MSSCTPLFLVLLDVLVADQNRLAAQQKRDNAGERAMRAYPRIALHLFRISFPERGHYESLLLGRPRKVGHNSCKVAKTPGHYLKPLTCPLNDIGGRRLQSYFQSLPAPMSSQEGCRSWLLDALIPIVHISLLPLGNWNFFQFTALDKHFIPSGKVDLI